jgi:type VI secretion system protein ImpF
MRAPEKQKDRLQIPLMFAFRDAHEKRDAAKSEDVRVDGERVVSERSSLRRRGADERLLKGDLATDLGNLVDTIDLDSVIDLSDRPYTRKSILNYGLYDLNHVVVDDGEAALTVMENLKRALLEHEPRLSPDSLVIERSKAEGDHVQQKIRFSVRAELICKPLDIPIEFVAEVDSASAKVMVSRPAGAA